MRATVGALVGLVVAAVVVAALGIALGKPASWVVLAGGVIAGLVMRAIAPGPGPVYVRGALAALAAGLAAVGGPMASAEWLYSRGGASEGAAAPRDETPDARASDAGEAGAAPIVVQRERVDRGAGGGAPLHVTAPSDFHAAEIVSLVVGCLIAYTLGKGPPPLTEEEIAAAAQAESPQSGAKQAETAG